MFSYILVLVCFCAACVSYLKYKNIYNPPFLMGAFWTIITLFSTLGLYNQKIAGEKTYGICLLGMTGFFIGSFVDKRIVLHRKDKYIEKEETQGATAIIANSKFVTVSLLVLIIILLLRDIRVMAILASGIKMNQIRVDFNNVVLNSSFERALNTYIIMPLIYLLPAIVIPEFIAFRRQIKNLILTIIVLIEFTFCDGGRVPFFYCAVFVFCSLYIFHVDFHNVVEMFQSTSKKTKRITGIAAIGIVVIAVYMIAKLSTSREIHYTIGNSIYSYFTGCFPFLEHNLNKIEENNIYTYGAAFSHGILNVIFYLLNTLKICKYPTFYNVVHEWGNVQEFIQIGSSNFNAFVTPFYYFYMDFRYFGVLLGGIAYGTIATQIYVRMKKQSIYQYKYVAAYMLIIQSIVTSMVRWQFYNANFVMAFIILGLFPSRKNEK